jgi:uncharacterized protein YdhG (YjbR/CyaY superfamily)
MNKCLDSGKYEDITTQADGDEIMAERSAPETIDDYIAAFTPDVRTILEKIRATVREAAPRAEEKISYKMPAFALDGILIYFAAFKKHIGIYPPVRGDEKLDKKIARYRGPKGNLQLPLDEPIPYELIRSIVKFRVKERLKRVRSDDGVSYVSESSNHQKAPKKGRKRKGE